MQQNHSLNGKTRSSAGFGTDVLIASILVPAGTIYTIGSTAKIIFLAQEEEIIPIIVGSDLDQIPALLRGNLPTVTTSLTHNLPKRENPPRMCEMNEDYFEKIDRGKSQPVGYTVRNEYVQPFRDRRGFLNERELRAAKVAWHYFEKFTQESTSLANLVGNYPSTTMWDTASYIVGTVAAFEFCLIEKPEFDRRIIQLLTTVKELELFRKEMPNKVYHTKTGAKVDSTNKPGEIGFSALDIGRFLV